MVPFMQQNKELEDIHLHCIGFLHLQLYGLFIQQGVYDLTVEELWNLLYPGDTTPEWSPQCALNEVNICHYEALKQSDCLLYVDMAGLA